MESQKTTQTPLSFWRLFAILEITLFVGVALLCWLGGGLTRLNYANGLFLAGALVMVIGALVIVGNRTRIHPASRAAEHLNYNVKLLKERVQHAQTMNEAMWDFGPLVALGGFVPVLVSVGLSLLTF